MPAYSNANDKPKIRNEYQPSGKEEELLRRVYKRKLAMEEGSDYKKASAKWGDWRKLWEAEWQKMDEEWQSNHIVPLVPSVIETALAEMIDQSPQPILMARGSEDTPKATVMRHVWDYVWEVSNSDAAMYDIMKEALTCGTAIAQEYYLQAPRTIRYKVRVGGKIEEREEKVLDYDDCVLEPVKLEEFRVDESARGFTGPYAARDCLRRYLVDIDDFRAYFSQPGWDEFARNLDYLRPGGDLNYYEFYKPPEGIDKKKQLEALWYWSVAPDDWLVVVANDVLTYAGPNIYKHKKLPFVRAIDIKRPHAFYHKGEPEILASTQDEKNTLRRMGIDRSHLDLDKMFAVSNRLQLDEEDLIARPHGMIPVDDVAQIKPIDYNDTPRSTELALKQLDEDGIIATGIDPRLAALPQGGTATEAAIVKESALKRIRLKLRLLERETLVDVARLRIANIMQFYSQPKLEKIVGEKGTVAYQQKIDRLASQGLLVQKDGQDFRESYRTIRLTDKELVPNTVGQFEEKPIKGYSFFELRPDYFMPTASNGFDIKFKAGATLPVSKPLMQTKAAEMYDRLVQNPAYDPQKLGDLLLEVNDYEPGDYHIEQQAQPEEQDQRLSQLIDLAMQENKQMAQGVEVPPTEFASPAHSMIHVQFMRSDQVPADPKILQLFSDHVTGEIMAQQQRQTAGGGMEGFIPGQAGQPGGAEGIGGKGMGGKMTSVQSGEGLRRGVSGKVKKPQLSMSDLIPQKITGVNSLPVQA